MSDQMDLLVEQVKMLAGEIAFSRSNLKRLVEQSVNDPDGSKTQVKLSLPILLRSMLRLSGGVLHNVAQATLFCMRLFFI